MGGVISSEFFGLVAVKLVTISTCVALVVTLFLHIDTLKVLVISKFLTVFAQYLVDKSVIFIKLAGKRYHFIIFNYFFIFIAKKHIALSQSVMYFINHYLNTH